MATEHAPQSPSAQPSLRAGQAAGAQKFQQRVVFGETGFDANQLAVQGEFKCGEHNSFIESQVNRKFLWCFFQLITKPN